MDASTSRYGSVSRGSSPPPRRGTSIARGERAGKLRTSRARRRALLSPAPSEAAPHVRAQRSPPPRMMKRAAMEDRGHWTACATLPRVEMPGAGEPPHLQYPQRWSISEAAPPLSGDGGGGGHVHVGGQPTRSLSRQSEAKEASAAYPTADPVSGRAKLCTSPAACCREGRRCTPDRSARKDPRLSCVGRAGPTRAARRGKG